MSVCVVKNGYFVLLYTSKQRVISVLTEADFSITQKQLHQSYNVVNLSIYIEPINVPDLFLRLYLRARSEKLI